ncbi:MAG: type IX secretion system membrane protein PorP/SprF [Chitinophagales bacterium]|nr:type IX secretion system membrane protein PorP/SprF [Chitinophagales bacterium]
MKKLYILFIIALLGSPLLAQQLPWYSLYRENNFMLNPAIVGAERHAIATVSYRHQWFKVQDAPKTMTAGFRAPLLRKSIGVGGNLIYDKTGPTGFIGGTAAISYHISFAKINPFHWARFLRKSKLSLGMSFSAYQYRLNSNELLLDQPNDPSINQNQNGKIMPNAGIGLYYYYDKFYLGFSIPNVIPFNIQFDDVNTSSNLKRELHYYVVAGGKIPIGPAYKPTFTIEPMVWFKTVKNAPFQVDAHVRFKYKDFFWLGAGYRTKQTVVFDASVLIKKQIQISYAYDQQLSDVRSYIGNSHEILIGYHFPEKKKRYKRYD